MAVLPAVPTGGMARILGATNSVIKFNVPNHDIALFQSFLHFFIAINFAGLFEPRHRQFRDGAEQPEQPGGGGSQCGGDGETGWC